MAEDNPSKDIPRKPPSAAVGKGTAWLIVIAALLVSAAASAFYGASNVGSHVEIETSCRLLARAQRDGLLDARQRLQVTQAAHASAALSPTARAAAERVFAGGPCRGVRT